MRSIAALPPALAEEVERWLDLDPDPETRTQLQELVVSDPDRVAALFDGRVALGTAGLRAPMGPGPTRMNQLVVAQTTEGLLRWLPPGAVVVVGYDARHRSKRFADQVARSVAEAGGQAKLLPGPTPTPILALAVLDEGADAGVMITASHNPPDDNGYKLYLADGIQLVGPADREISAHIDQTVADATSPGSGAPRAGAGSITQLDDGPGGPADRHVQAAIGASVTDHRDVTVLYTPLHGVGGDQLLRVFEGAGFPPPLVVDAQYEPDPTFPTVAFPNPEEPGALDLALAQAEAAGGTVDVILANDPDADRLAVAAPDPSGRWRALSGDELGVLLADHLLRHTAGEDRLVSSSIVSSRMIEAVAAHHGAESVRTLTGFKWVARPIVDRQDRRFVLGYEEALGYCVGAAVRDKDGISAAVVAAELAAEVKAEGSSLFARLDELAREHGVHATAPVTLRFDPDTGIDQRTRAMARATDDPPTELAGVAVVDTEDLAEGRTLPPTAGVRWDLADGSRVLVRPSGTEPKLKAYLEVIEPVTDSVGAARAAAADRLDALQRAVDDRLRSGL